MLLPRFLINGVGLRVIGSKYAMTDLQSVNLLHLAYHHGSFLAKSANFVHKFSINRNQTRLLQSGDLLRYYEQGSLLVSPRLKSRLAVRIFISSSENVADTADNTIFSGADSALCKPY